MTVYGTIEVRLLHATGSITGITDRMCPQQQSKCAMSRHSFTEGESSLSSYILTIDRARQDNRCLSSAGRPDTRRRLSENNGMRASQTTYGNLCGSTPRVRQEPAVIANPYPITLAYTTDFVHRINAVIPRREMFACGESNPMALEASLWQG
ncbi:hypothetical protein FKP32DRAFT_1069045 [Trametes sanguinea]|nr:hypothetical protein FKP32DRAFT_1069045 [Trametes sanguinea]